MGEGTTIDLPQRMPCYYLFMNVDAIGSVLAIEAVGLAKSFGGKRAVAGLDLAVPAGGVFGFLGPNGAGKTTTIRMLATLLPPDSGTARVLGLDVVKDANAVRRRVSLTGQYASVDEDLTGHENLMMVGRLRGYRRSFAKSRAIALADALGLGEAGARLVKTYSGGTLRLLDIAMSVVAPPDLIFLDEPTTGLDPVNRNRVWDIVGALTSAGSTVLLTTQYLEEADRLADRIAVIDHGKVIAEGSPAELKTSVRPGSLQVRLASAASRAEACQIMAALVSAPVRLEPDPVVLRVGVGDAAQAAMAMAELARLGITVTDFALSRPSLDEVFLALTGHGTTTDETARSAASTGPPPVTTASASSGSGAA